MTTLTKPTTVDNLRDLQTKLDQLERRDADLAKRLLAIRTDLRQTRHPSGS